MLRAYARRQSLSEAEWELLPDFVALYNLADATSYISGRIKRGTPANQAVADCGSYARDLEHTSAPDWRSRLRAALVEPDRFGD
ncbi:MAG: hypothetical protein ACRDJN_28120 [Chloroflexota bacterium]